ncbi:hypothetical protein HaLaN_12986 [Haematococcus lacustris]|uniref:Uncharacterized protein n=1 Tax=Haematococcus lacustris TaxID=44745 RepID=A0A699ZBC5_HAELA|nr:hypothetical protein HaLaN_12986 [Haematococcus lacustris]
MTLSTSMCFESIPTGKCHDDECSLAWLCMAVCECSLAWLCVALPGSNKQQLARLRPTVQHVLGIGALHAQRTIPICINSHDSDVPARPLLCDALQLTWGDCVRTCGQTRIQIPVSAKPKFCWAWAASHAVPSRALTITTSAAALWGRASAPPAGHHALGGP